MPNKRYFTRVKFDTDASIKFDNTVYSVELLDISLKGALIHSESILPLKYGDICVLKITLPSSNITLKFDAELVHICQPNLGFKFLSEDLDTMSHLRRLLELNTGSHEKITNELPFFWLKK